MDPRSLKVAEMFANLKDTARADAILNDLYDPACVFMDPIQKAEGLEAIRAMNRRLATKMGPVTVKLLGDALEDRTLVIRWVMTFKAPFMRKSGNLEGVSWMEFNAAGKCTRHTDYWDMGGLLDEVIPIAKPLHDVVRKLAG
ncbi:MAG: nuclear transport factor 2 family protein [Deltaproteobacteria bacterium]|nr:nuclear transport factor 2 family protein [Deltaproteobacteria bacterium]